jgi:hypothetical protein
MRQGLRWANQRRHKLMCCSRSVLSAHSRDFCEQRRVMNQSMINEINVFHAIHSKRQKEVRHTMSQ